MLASIVVRTKIAKFGPGQFNFVLAKTEIAVFGPGQHHPARGGERFRRIFARARAPDVRPFCWTDLTIRYLVLSSVLHRTHSV